MVASACETESCWKPATAPMARIFFFLGWAASVDVKATLRARRSKTRGMHSGYRKQEQGGRSHLLNAAQRIDLGMKIRIFELFPIVGDLYQFAADVVGL